MAAAWFAATTTVPEPVKLSVLPFVPLTLPGPETMLKTTGLPLAPPVATRVTGAAPKLTGVVGGVKLIVCAIGLTTSVCGTCVAAA